MNLAWMAAIMLAPQLTTRWTGDALAAEAPWPEYPRPQLVREEWLNLNGMWEFAVIQTGAPIPTALTQKIRVPYPIASHLSGVRRPLAPQETAVYRREFTIPREWNGRRVLLHFGAVDWHAQVSVNDTLVGEHFGGYDPFSFDITDALKPGANTITVLVQDPTDTGYQPVGKQRLKPEAIWYTQVDGIWQTVWLEPVPDGHIVSADYVTHLDGRVRIRVQTANGDGMLVEAVVLSDGREVARAVAPSGSDLRLKVPNPRLWSPRTPSLYDVVLRLTRNGERVDEARGYFGIRTIEVREDDFGARMYLNGEPLFMYGVLDQGYWPDGLYTPPSDAAMRFDLDFLKRAGFNTVRKHVKVEPARWYYHCDQLGLLVWQDMPNGDKSPPWNRDWRSENPNADTMRSAESARNYRRELAAMVNHLRSFPCIVMWVPFNEAWGQFDTLGVVRWLKVHDPTRLVNPASGGNFVNAGDVLDIHEYPGPAAPEPEPGRAAVLGEFGGLGLAVQSHLWAEDGNWGYRTLPDRDTLEARYVELLDSLNMLRGRGLSAAIYTQLTDVETEVNGLLTYDRAVEKIPADKLREIHARLYGPIVTTAAITPTADDEAVEWRYTEAAPGAEWHLPGFDDSTWKVGLGGFGRHGTPGARIGTEWESDRIWLRRTFHANALDGDLWLKIHHDEDVEVFVNGTRVVTREGYTTDYIWLRLRPSLVKSGANTIAVTCRQTVGGQYIDVGIYQARR
ncbi:MAG: sugar-binding domain-containing protein [Armatimonadota bacterium]